MKKVLITAVIAATMASTGAYAACSAAIDMGSNQINALADPTAAQDAATKAYVDAASALPNTCTAGSANKTFAAAAEECAATNSWIPRSVAETTAAGCTTVDLTWIDTSATWRPFELGGVNTAINALVISSSNLHQLGTVSAQLRPFNCVKKN